METPTHPQSSRRAAIELIVHFFTLPIEVLRVPDFIQNVDFERDWKKAVLAVIFCQICGPFIFLLMLFLGFLGLYVAIIQLVEPFFMRHNCVKRSIRQIFEELSVLMFEDDEIDNISHTDFVEIPDGTYAHIPGPSMSTDQFTTFQQNMSTHGGPRADEDLRAISISHGRDDYLGIPEQTQSLTDGERSRAATDNEISVDSVDLQPEFASEKGPKSEVAQSYLTRYQNEQAKKHSNSQENLSPKHEEMATLEESKVVTTQRKKIIDAMSTATPDRRAKTEYLNKTSPGNVKEKTALFQN